jgi:hypothetical protein
MTSPDNLTNPEALRVLDHFYRDFQGFSPYDSPENYRLSTAFLMAYDALAAQQTAVKAYDIEEPATGMPITCGGCGQSFFQRRGDRFDYCPGCGRRFDAFQEPENRSQNDH